MEDMTGMDVFVVGKEFCAGVNVESRLNAWLQKLTGTTIDFCLDDAETVERIELLGHVPYVKPVGRKFTCAFDYDGTFAITVPFKTEALALAMTLLFLLSKDK